MKTITVKELKANWAQIEAQVKAGETFEVLNRGRVAAHVVPATPRKVLRWPDHLKRPIRTCRKGSNIVLEQRIERHDLYLDTSPFMMLYLYEQGSAEVIAS